MKHRKWLYVVLGVGVFLIVSYFVQFKIPCGSCSALGCWDGMCDTRLIIFIVNRFNVILLTVVGTIVYFWRKQKVIFVLELILIILYVAWWLKQPMGISGF